MKAPDLQVTQWFNTDRNLTLSDFSGKVLVIEAFQMLCPGCVLHGIPLAQSISRTFSSDQVAVIGLHSVFEHHEAMTPTSLAAFLHEYRIDFPVGVDAPSKAAIPKTMLSYRLQGTPSLLLIDKSGHLRGHHFGQVSELQLGAEIATLMNEPAAVDFGSEPSPDGAVVCGPSGCVAPG